MRSFARAIGALSLAVLVNSCDPTGPAAAAVADFLLNYCSGTAPVFLAYKNEGGNWTAVTLDANNKATIQVTQKFGLAEITQGSRYITWVYYTTRDEWKPAPSTCPTTPSLTKSVNGTLAGLGSTYGWSYTTVGNSGGGYTNNPTVDISLLLPDAPVDLIATRSSFAAPYATDKVIVRRAQNPAAGSTMAVLDFGSSEALAPGIATLTLSNGTGGDFMGAATYSYVFSAEAYAYFAGSTTSSSSTLYGRPASAALASDMQVLDVYSYTNSTPSTGSMQRGADVFQRNLANVAITLPSNIAAPTFTTVNTTPKRIRAQIASSADLGAIIYVYFSQSASGTPRAGVAMTSAYLGGTPATWELEMPDLTGLTGYPTGANLPNAAHNWSIWAANSSKAYFHDFVDVADGTVINWAYRYSITATAAVRAPGSVSETDLERPRMPGAGGFRALHR